MVLDVQWLTGAQAVLVWLSAGPVLSWQGLAFENELGCTVAKVTDSSSLAPRRLHCCYHQRKATTRRDTRYDLFWNFLAHTASFANSILLGKDLL